MAVVEVEPDRIDANRLDLGDLDGFLRELELALAAAMAANFGRWRIDAQVLEGEREPCAVLPGDLEDPGLLLDRDGGRYRHQRM